MQVLEFVNTVEPRTGPVSHDALPNYDALVDWAALPEATAARLRRVARADPAGAERALRAAIKLREALFALFGALADGDRPASEPVEVLRRHYVAACRSATWDITPSHARWHWADDDLSQIAARVAVDAVALAGAAVSIKQCPPEHGGCGWLFVDSTKNGSRRWCSMADCGNTSKARRLAARRKVARAATRKAAP